MGLVDAIKNIFVSKKSEDGRIPADILYTKDVRRLTSSDYIRYFKSWVYIASTTIASDIATADFQTIQGKRVVEHDIEKLLTWRVLYLT
ncbi:MAG: hypothetical protein EKK61_04200 [Rickettsiales bacterium]|nr:MAG: hypothetical protein EKK61_04200 [Rickettsiales bacterium]